MIHHDVRVLDRHTSRPSAFTRGVDCWHDVTAKPDQRLRPLCSRPLRLISPSSFRASKVVAPSSERGRGKVMRRSFDSHGSNFAFFFFKQKTAYEISTQLGIAGTGRSSLDFG